ncbi:intraflagellar transport protein 52 homolog [Amphibalanus amphitrite]|uniref:intraflagellar transport protein 52 homolog n=1 Tax=Amphibalanus amphitrite TaxID=1232801 RepID=UPI001C91356F|nr:intraflagellar transport protein 52 homolog [Amphibalanus amphitrite]XP_043215420.1 intraflagellar transport protein 52 homolog [Amphibalanus amphitrite]XP_043215421.1 intraflagellar transport protein 52 homolog [Amphibalanus amphitrite]XP_043215422.1 intraflagellar transport protein 52 homolog [Amphibalanus amphitrite]XP_043215423.1 intraflagellar transport protein 52 homolog [Amphibalanus amphitrite]XP_043215424.1 intraflagellar transport protein 52 homolog [Amphibalanus amphitrite]XP_04
MPPSTMNTEATGVASATRAASGAVAAALSATGAPSATAAPAAAPVQAAAAPFRNGMIFDAAKGETATTTSGFKTLIRKLKGTWRISSNKDEMFSEILAQTRLYILPGPKDKFSAQEFEMLKKYVDEGGSLLVMLGEGGEKLNKTNINYLLEEYGMSINSDAVVRTQYYKYFHPKECYISNGILNRQLGQLAGKTTPGVGMDDDGNNPQALVFLYPFGATINVAKPAVPLLSTGSVAFPSNRPICGLYQNDAGGKIIALGSVAMLTDQYLEKEENSKIKDVLFDMLCSGDQVTLNRIDASNPEINDYNLIPSMGLLAERPRVCLQESDSVPADLSKLFDTQVYSVNTRLVPQALDIYNQLNVKHEMLRLITPQFETPMPPLQPAIFPPAFRELDNPPLELYDLDEAFSSDKARLAQVTNKCTDTDLEFFVNECGEILGITAGLQPECRTARHILEHVLFQLTDYRKLNQGG